jgi:hypothetical protein
MMSWRPEVFVESRWSANALRFATEAEAKASAFNLLMRWALCEDSRATESDDPVNYRWDDTAGLVAIATEASQIGGKAA